MCSTMFYHHFASDLCSCLLTNMLLQVPQEVKLCKTRQCCSSLVFSYQYILGFLCKLCVNCISTLIQHICMLSTQYFTSQEVMTSSCCCLERSFLVAFAFCHSTNEGKRQSKMHESPSSAQNFCARAGRLYAHFTLPRAAR